MRTAREGIAFAALLTIFTALAGCSGPPVAVPTEPQSVPAPAQQQDSRTVDEPVSNSAAAGGQAATQQTCNGFREMIEGIDTLSSQDQQVLIDKMADAVQYTGNAELMRAVVDMGQGWSNSDPQQFATGMRALSRICNVPYN